MHSQIALLRQTVLDLRETNAKEIGDLRRQIDALETSGPGNAKARFDDIDSRLRAVEQQPGGSGMVRHPTSFRPTGRKGGIPVFLFPGANSEGQAAASFFHP